MRPREWATLIGCLVIVATIYCAGINCAESKAALITDTSGTILRPEQNWDNRNFLKARNLRVIVYRQHCPNSSPNTACVFPDRPLEMYLVRGPWSWGNRFLFYHEYFHNLHLSGLYRGPLWINDEITADLYASCAMRAQVPFGGYVERHLRRITALDYRAACNMFITNLHHINSQG